MNPAAVESFPPQYRDVAQRHTANHLGIWTFLATEILLFGGLLLGYTVYRHAYPEAFALGSHRLEFWIGTINTAVLLTSSLCVALADHAIKLDQRRALRAWIIAAWLLGAAFLALKGYEYYQKFAEHLVPGPHFNREDFGTDSPAVQLFMGLYFTLTGLHAAHMLIGLGAMTWLLWLDHRRALSAARHGPVEMVGIYWHFVDCVWVFLYPLLYLIPHH